MVDFGFFRKERQKNIIRRANRKIRLDFFFPIFNKFCLFKNDKGDLNPPLKEISKATQHLGHVTLKVFPNRMGILKDFLQPGQSKIFFPLFSKIFFK
jgi:hypothetical protein